MIGILLIACAALLFPWSLRLEWPKEEKPPRPVPIDEAMVIDLMSALLSSGSAIPRALEALGASLPGGEDSQEALRAGRILLLGGSWEEAWEDATRLRRLANALEPSWNDGAPPVALLQRAARAIRARRLKDSQTAAAKLGVKLVLPLGLCFLPAFFLIGVVPIIASLGATFFQ